MDDLARGGAEFERLEGHESPEFMGQLQANLEVRFAISLSGSLISTQ